MQNEKLGYKKGIKPLFKKKKGLQNFANP